METERTYTSFASEKLVASGDLKTMLLGTKKFLDRHKDASVLIFDDHTGRQVDFDFRGKPQDVLERLSSHPLFATHDAADNLRTGPGRPKLGVVCREVSLLPRHWDWLEQQPQGISSALRRLVEDARKNESGKDRARFAREAAGKFMWSMAGDLPGFEEASRALFANDQDRFQKLISDWPKDIRTHLWSLIQHSNKIEKSSGPSDSETAKKK